MLVAGPFLDIRARMSVWVLSGGFVWFSTALFSSPEELVQASALFSPWLPLGPTSLLLAETVLSVGAGVSVWVLSGFLSGLRFLPGGNKGPFWRNFPGVRLILAVAAPEASIFAGGGACFVLRGQSERLDVEWRFCLCLVLYFLYFSGLGFYLGGGQDPCQRRRSGH